MVNISPKYLNGGQTGTQISWMKTKLIENVVSNPKAIFKRSSRIVGTEKKKNGKSCFSPCFRHDSVERHFEKESNANCWGLSLKNCVFIFRCRDDKFLPPCFFYCIYLFILYKYGFFHWSIVDLKYCLFQKYSIVIWVCFCFADYTPLKVIMRYWV